MSLVEKKGVSIGFSLDEFSFILTQVKLINENEQGNYEEILMCFDGLISTV